MGGATNNIDKYITHLAQNAEESSRTLKLVGGYSCGDIVLLVTLLIERASQTALTCSSLLPLYQRNPGYEYSLGLILRTSMLDVLVSLNVFQILRDHDFEESDDLEKFSFDILRDGFEFMFKSLANDCRLHLITKDELLEAHINCVKKFPPFFENYDFDGTFPVLKPPFNKKKPTGLNLYESLRSAPEFVPRNADIYRKYSGYSKYEHLNFLYHPLSRAPKEHLDERLCACFDHLLMQSHMLHDILANLRPEINSLVDQAEKIGNINNVFWDNK